MVSPYPIRCCLALLGHKSFFWPQRFNAPSTAGVFLPCHKGYLLKTKDVVTAVGSGRMLAGHFQVTISSARFSFERPAAQLGVVGLGSATIRSGEEQGVWTACCPLLQYSPRIITQNRHLLTPVSWRVHRPLAPTPRRTHG